MFKWSLNESQFNFLDRLKICGFFLNPRNFWTQNRQVCLFEREMAEKMGYKYSVFVSSGSTANTILAMYLRDKLKSLKEKERNIVVLPSVTWQTSCSPWIREGFDPYFIDVSMENYGMDLDKLQDFLAKNHEKIAVVFPTALLGFNLNYAKLNSLKELYPDIEFFIDQCENNFGVVDDFSGMNSFQKFTCTTSTYFGHEIQSVEGGFLLTNDINEYRKFILYRNHGMVRSLENTSFDKEENKEHSYEIANKDVDFRFDFNLMGSNFRNTDINAFIGRLDLRKCQDNIDKRRNLYKLFVKKINRNRYHLALDGEESRKVSPFCLPIITKGDDKQDRNFILDTYLMATGIETRPIISGFLGYQKAYIGLLDEKDHPNAVYLHKNGRYVGLHPKVTEKQMNGLIEFLNQI